MKPRNVEGLGYGWNLEQYMVPDPLKMAIGLPMVVVTAIYYAIAIAAGTETAWALVAIAAAVISVYIGVELMKFDSTDSEAAGALIICIGCIITSYLAAFNGVSSWWIFLFDALLGIGMPCCTHAITGKAKVSFIRKGRAPEKKIGCPSIDASWTMDVARCPSCKEVTMERGARFCPKCGAAMDVPKNGALDREMAAAQMTKKEATAARSAAIISALRSKIPQIAAWITTHQNITNKMMSDYESGCNRVNEIPAMKIDDECPFRFYDSATRASLMYDRTIGVIAQIRGVKFMAGLKNDPIAELWKKNARLLKNDETRHAIVTIVAAIGRWDPEALADDDVVKFLERANTIVDAFPDRVKKTAEAIAYNVSEKQRMLAESIENGKREARAILESRSMIATGIVLP